MIHRGGMYWADLGEASGSEPAKRRPVLVILDKADLGAQAGQLPDSLIDDVDRGLRRLLSPLARLEHKFTRPARPRRTTRGTSAHSRGRAIMNNHATWLGLGGAGGSCWKRRLRG